MTYEVNRDNIPPRPKKNKGCIIAVVVILLAILGLMIYIAIDYKTTYHKEWDTFDDERIAAIEKYLYITMPEGAEPVKFKRDVGPGDSCTRLIVGGISDPQQFMEKAFPGVEIKELAPDDELNKALNDSISENKKVDILKKVPTDNKSFGSIKYELDETASMLGYSIEITEIYSRIRDEHTMDRYYIGFGKADDGYYADIYFLVF